MNESDKGRVAAIENDSEELLTDATRAVREALPDLIPAARAEILIGLVQARATLACSLRLALLEDTLVSSISEAERITLAELRYRAAAKAIFAEVAEGSG